MPCYRPLQAYLCASGAVVFAELRRHNIHHSLLLPCGQCVGCRLERSRQWATRCMHEAQMHKRNAFITLTWKPEQLRSPSLSHRDWQLFMKRLRRHVDRHAPGAPRLHAPPGHLLSKKGIRFYMAGEYGSQHRRPHFHACLFGWDFPDQKYWKTTPSGSKLYTSATLDKLWGHGFTSVGAVTFESAAYIARYIMKKITGDLADLHYNIVDNDTGEITKLKPEYNKMSLNPALGKSWLEKYKTDAYPEGKILTRGHKVKTPKYYDNQYKKGDAEKYEELKATREIEALQYRNDNTPQRLQAKETVTKAKLTLLKRHI